MSEPEEILSFPQQQVLTLLAQGSTVSAAADAAGVHRNTVANWRRAGSQEFRKCWDAAQLEQSAYWRDRIQALGDLAIQALQQILEDPKASASVRLKAATTVLNSIASPAAAKTAQSAQRREETSELDRSIAHAVHPVAPACAPKNPAQVAQQELDRMILKHARPTRAAAACASQNLAQTCTTASGIHAVAATP